MFIVSRVRIWVDDGDEFFWGVVRVKLSFESNKVHRGIKEWYEEFRLGNKKHLFLGDRNHPSLLGKNIEGNNNYCVLPYFLPPLPKVSQPSFRHIFVNTTFISTFIEYLLCTRNCARYGVYEYQSTK